MQINNIFSIGSIVYPKTCPNQFGWMVTEIVVGKNSIAYRCSFVDQVCTFEEFELSSDKDIIKSCGLTNAEQN